MYNFNKCGTSTILIAAIGTLIFAQCLNEEKQELWGNMILLIGQILVTIPLLNDTCDCGREKNCLDDGCFGHGKPYDGFNY